MPALMEQDHLVKGPRRVEGVVIVLCPDRKLYPILLCTILWIAGFSVAHGLVWV